MKERDRGPFRSGGTGTSWVVVCIHRNVGRDLHALSEVGMYKVMYRLWGFDTYGGGVRSSRYGWIDRHVCIGCEVSVFFFFFFWRRLSHGCANHGSLIGLGLFCTCPASQQVRRLLPFFRALGILRINHESFFFAVVKYFLLLLRYISTHFVFGINYLGIIVFFLQWKKG